MLLCTFGFDVARLIAVMKQVHVLIGVEGWVVQGPQV